MIAFLAPARGWNGDVKLAGVLDLYGPRGRSAVFAFGGAGRRPSRGRAGRRAADEGPFEVFLPWGGSPCSWATDHNIHRHVALDHPNGSSAGIDEQTARRFSRLLHSLGQARRQNRSLVGLDIQRNLRRGGIDDRRLKIDQARIIPPGIVRDGTGVEALSSRARCTREQGLDKRVRVASPTEIVVASSSPPIADLMDAAVHRAQDEIRCAGSAVLDFHPLDVVDTPEARAIVLVAAT
jgi:hypothetical protein